MDRPIFVVGCGRSGTTLVYHLLAGHPDLGWFSNHMARYVQIPQLAALVPMFKHPAIRRRLGSSKLLPKPDEAYQIWRHFHPQVNDLQQPRTVLDERHAAEADDQGLYDYIGRVLRYSRSRRFLNKNTRNTLRIRYVQALFPDAQFVHVIRDGRAVTNSLTNVSWWSDLSLWWANEQRPADLERRGEDVVSIAARSWSHTTRKAMMDKDALRPGQYLELRYEHLTQRPREEMARVLDFLELPTDDRFSRHIDSFEISDRNAKWERNFSPEQKSAVEAICGDLLASLGYA